MAEPQRPRVNPGVEEWRSCDRGEVVVIGVGVAVGAGEIRVDVAGEITPGAGGDARPLRARRRAVSPVGRIEDRAVQLAEAVAADEVVQEADAGGLAVRGALALDADAAAGGASGGAVAGDGGVDEPDDVFAGDVQAIPGVPVDGVADEVVGAAMSVDESDAVAAVGVDERVGDEGVRVTAGDGDTAVALGGAVAEDPQPVEVDGVVVVVAAEQRLR